MGILKLISIIPLLLSSLIFSKNSIRDYPNWFLYPAQFCSITTGFSSPDSSAKHNAAKRLSVFNGSVVKGKLFLYEVLDDSDLNKYTDYYYYYSYELAENYSTQFISIDKHIINTLNKEYIEAFTLDTTNEHDFSYINVDTLKKPDWINKSFYEQDGYHYSIGMYTSIGRDIDAWITSEEKAMFNLLRNIYSDIYGVRNIVDSQNDADDEYEKIIAYKLNAKMNNIEVVERFPDRNAQLYFTLIRVKKENIKIIDQQ